jgi:hypothetical protein
MLHFWDRRQEKYAKSYNSPFQVNIEAGGWFVKALAWAGRD